MIGGLITSILAPLVGVVAPIIQAARPHPDVALARIAAQAERDRQRHELRLARLKRRK